MVDVYAAKRAILALFMISTGKLSDAIARVCAELKIHTAFSFFCMIIGGSLSTCLGWGLGDWRRTRRFEEMKGYSEVQQEVHIRTSGTRGMGKVAYWERNLTFLKAETHIEELVAVCEKAG